jgi:hypothetical protein
MTTLALLSPLLYVWLLWALFVFVMGIYRARMDGRLSGLAFAMALPVYVVGYVMDVVANLTLACLVFWEPPRELLVTGRLKRYIEAGVGWRFKAASWLCDSLLDPFDPKGTHCKCTSPFSSPTSCRPTPCS